MNPTSNKRRGAKWETDALEWFRLTGFKAERLRLAGRQDEGDLVVEDHFILELKAPGRGNPIDLSGWLKEARLEVGNFAARRNIEPTTLAGAVLIKAPGKSIADAYLVFRVGDFFRRA